MEKLITFLDFANIDRAAQDLGWPIDYGQFAAYLAEGRRLIEAHAFVPRDPRAAPAMDRTVETLWREGWLVHDKVGTPAGESYKCDFDVELTVEVMRTIELARPDIVVLLSGDGDFVPLVMELRRRGIRAEVAAFLDNTSRELLLRCSGFIDLDAWLDANRTETSREPETDDDTAWQDRDEEDGGQPPTTAHRLPATEL